MAKRKCSNSFIGNLVIPFIFFLIIPSSLSYLAKEGLNSVLISFTYKPEYVLISTYDDSIVYQKYNEITNYTYEFIFEITVGEKDMNYTVNMLTDKEDKNFTLSYILEKKNPRVVKSTKTVIEDKTKYAIIIAGIAIFLFITTLVIIVENFRKSIKES